MLLRLERNTLTAWFEIDHDDSDVSHVVLGAVALLVVGYGIRWARRRRGRRGSGEWESSAAGGPGDLWESRIALRTHLIDY